MYFWQGHRWSPFVRPVRRHTVFPEVGNANFVTLSCVSLQVSSLRSHCFPFVPNKKLVERQLEPTWIFYTSFTLIHCEWSVSAPIGFLTPSSFSCLWGRLFLWVLTFVGTRGFILGCQIHSFVNPQEGPGLMPSREDLCFPGLSPCPLVTRLAHRRSHSRLFLDLPVPAGIGHSHRVAPI